MVLLKPSLALSFEISKIVAQNGIGYKIKILFLVLGVFFYLVGL